MQNPQAFRWLQYNPPGSHSIDIKIEPANQEVTLYPHSPPSSPSVSRSAPNPPTAIPLSPVRRRSNTAVASPRRVRPYPATSPQDHRPRGEDSETMSHAPFSTWPASGTRSSRPLSTAERRSSENDQLTPYALNHNVYESRSFANRSDRSDNRPPASGPNMTPSSLSGAIGDTTITSDPRRSNSLSPKAEPYGAQISSPAMVWTSTSGATSQSTYSGQSGLPLSTSVQPIGNTASPYSHYPDYDPSSSSYGQPSPGSVHTATPAYAPFSEPFNYQHSRGQASMNFRPMGQTQFTPTTSVSPPPQSSSTILTMEDKAEDELRQLRKKVRELELINESARLRMRELESEIARDVSYNQVASTSAMGRPHSTPSPRSASFQASWKARTDARTKHFCSLNRAGNALCAWHDSRRERRAFPPRMAPPGQLNCGCTHDEALFEESLARHGVGSYHPGETVRMDPALRNPLLRLLQVRYGYKDGDFERDPITGEWLDGEGHLPWEQKAQAASGSRKPRGETDRR